MSSTNDKTENPANNPRSPPTNEKNSTKLNCLRLINGKNSCALNFTFTSDGVRNVNKSCLKNK